MKWLITGGCGFIGRVLINKLIADKAQRHMIRVLDNLSVGTREDLRTIADFEEIDDTSNWSTRIALFTGDIRDDETIQNVASGSEVIVHLAANTGVGPSVENPREDCDTNVRGTLNVLEACRVQSVKRLVFASSGAPLGVQIPPLNEKMAPRPASPYGASKLAGEGYCSAYFHCFGVEAVALRFGNVYGPGSGHKQSVVAKFIKEAMAGKAWEIYGNGEQTRDFIHITDLIDAVQKAAISEKVGGEVFQIATAAETTVLEMASLLADILEAEGIKRPDIYHGPLRDGDVMRNYSDTTKARDQLGWSAKISLEAGLIQTVRSFVNT